MTRRARRSTGGFTILEVTIAGALLLIATLAIGQALDSSLNVARTTDEFTRAQREGRLAIETLVREARVRASIVNASPPDDPGPLVLTFTTVGDPVAAIEATTIHYEVSDGALKRKQGDGALVSVIAGVLNDPLEPLFTYHDDETPSTIPSGSRAASTRRIHVNLVIDVKGRQPLVLATDLTFRGV